MSESVTRSPIELFWTAKHEDDSDQFWTMIIQGVGGHSETVELWITVKVK